MAVISACISAGSVAGIQACLGTSGKRVSQDRRKPAEWGLSLLPGTELTLMEESFRQRSPIRKT